MKQKVLIATLLLLIAAFSSPWLNGSHSSNSVNASALKPYPYIVNPFLSQVDVLIDVGHGGIDSGTLYGQIYEKNINLQIGKILYDTLSKKGLQVLLNRMDDYALSGENLWYRHRSRHLKDLAQRSHLANEIKPKIVISLHVNWSANSKAHGGVVLHQNTSASKHLAELLQQSLNNLYGTQASTHSGKTYFLLKHIQPPAVIVEMGFISNPLDREQMLQAEKQQHLAESIAAAIVTYLKEKQTP